MAKKRNVEGAHRCSGAMWQRYLRKIHSLSVSRLEVCRRVASTRQLLLGTGNPTSEAVKDFADEMREDPLLPLSPSSLSKLCPRVKYTRRSQESCVALTCMCRRIIYKSDAIIKGNILALCESFGSFFADIVTTEASRVQSNLGGNNFLPRSTIALSTTSTL